MRFLPRLAAISLFAGTALVLGVACFPDEQGDFDDFIDRTKGFSQVEAPSDAAAIDAKPPENAVEQLYVAICVSALANRSPDKALRYYVNTKYTPAADGGDGTGKLNLTLASLLGWDATAAGGQGAAVKPASVSKDQIRGTPFTTEIPVQGNGRFTAAFGTVQIDSEANSISGRASELTNTTFTGVFGSEDRFCAQLSGVLVKPYTVELKAEQNTCIFLKATDGEPLPTLAKTEFTCTLPQ